VYQYTLEAVEWFFKQDCSLVILACNTASVVFFFRRREL